MTTLIIDPSLFEIPSNMSKSEQFCHFMFLKNSIDFVSDCLDVSLDQYDGAPYIGNSESPPYRAPITKSLTVRNKYSEISKKIQKLVSHGKWIELQDNLIDNCPLQFEDTTVTEQKFKQYLYYIFSSGIHEKSLLLLSQKNSSCTPSISYSIGGNAYILSTVVDPAIDCSRMVSKYLKESASADSIFPQSIACSRLNEEFKEKLKKQGKTAVERRAIYILFGMEVASRNLYRKEPDISRKNPSYEVFVHRLGEYYLSVDVEHGALEVFKKHGQNPLHLGEYNFSCALSKKAEPVTHKLIV